MGIVEEVGTAVEDIRRPLLPSPFARLGLLRLVPDVPGLRARAVHSLDVGDAYRGAVTGDARGAFNIAAEPRSTPDSSPGS